MFKAVINSTAMRSQLRRMFDAPLARLAGVAFVALAMMSIEYDEVIAPGVSRLSEACAAAAHGVSRKLATSFAL